MFSKAFFERVIPLLITFNVPRNNLEDSLNWWDIHYCYSTDNGITWSVPINLTESSTNRLGLQQIAKRIDVLRNQFFYIYVIDAVVNHDPLWHIWGEIGIDWMYICFDHASITGIEEEQLSPTPQKSNTFEFYPNPFRDKTVINYSIIYGAEHIELKIYDAAGKLVRLFPRFTLDALHPTHITWQGDDDFARPVPAGVYFVHLLDQNSKRLISRKILKIK